MNFKKILAGAAAVVTAAVSMAIPASAELVEREIAYNGPSENAIATADNGTDIRLNIYNIWSTPTTTDIDVAGNYAEYIEVTFTIEGIGENDRNYNEDGSEGAMYAAQLVGQIGTTTAWEGTPETPITGDGEYTVQFPLTEATAGTDDSSCLILQTNINKYSLENEGAAVKFDVISIKTFEDVYALPGDVNGDGNIDVFDAIAVAQYTVGKKTLDETQLALADYDGNGDVDVFDAIAIAKSTVA